MWKGQGLRKAGDPPPRSPETHFPPGPPPLVCSILLPHAACSSPVTPPVCGTLAQPPSGPSAPGGAPILSSAAGMSFLKTHSAAGLLLCMPRLCAGAKLRFLLALRARRDPVLPASFHRAVLERVEQAEGRAGADTELPSGRGV